MTAPESIPETSLPRIDDVQEHLTDGEVLRELYHRFKVGTLERYRQILDSPIVEQLGTPEQPRFRVHNRAAIRGKCRVDLYRMIWARYEIARLSFVPDELERRKAGLRSRGCREDADRLVELKPDADLIRVLFDHPGRLPSFLRPGEPIGGTTYDALVWLHFELYPDLRRKFGRGEFPAIKDLPCTVLGKASTDPTGTPAPEQTSEPAADSMAQAEDEAKSEAEAERLERERKKWERRIARKATKRANRKAGKIIDRERAKAEQAERDKIEAVERARIEQEAAVREAERRAREEAERKERDRLSAEKAQRELASQQAAASGREKPWDDKRPEFILISEARSKYCDGPNAPDLSCLGRTHCRPDGEFDYMHRGQRRKVHEQQFAEYADKQEWTKASFRKAEEMVEAHKKTREGRLAALRKEHDMNWQDLS